jgi:hypothetical protein
MVPVAAREAATSSIVQRPDGVREKGHAMEITAKPLGD